MLMSLCLTPQNSATIYFTRFCSPVSFSFSLPLRLDPLSTSPITSASTKFSVTFGATLFSPSLLRSGGTKTSKYLGTTSADNTARITMCANMKPKIYGGSYRRVWNSG